MITRVLGNLIDVWLAVAPFARGAAEAWRRLPGDLLGQAVSRLSGGLTVSREIPQAGGPPAIVVEDPRAGRYLDSVPLRPHAQTLGRYIFARERVSDAILRHELTGMGAGTPGKKAADMLDIGRPDLDWVSLARGMGVEASRATTAEEFNRQFAAGLASHGPRLIEAVL